MVRSGTVDGEETHIFSNNTAGHQALLRHLLRGKGRARVCFEASGNYSLDLALTLHTSGTTVDKKPRISRGGSRHLRRALYMPALVAIRHEPHLRAFFQRLVAHGKAPLQAVVAVMRKLLHAFFAMFRTDQSYDGSKLCLVELAADPVARCAA